MDLSSFLPALPEHHGCLNILLGMALLELNIARQVPVVLLLLLRMYAHDQQILVKAAAACDVLRSAVQPVYRIGRVAAGKHALVADMHLNLLFVFVTAQCSDMA